MSQQPAAVIHDIRYSRFSGELRPRRAAVLALARSSAQRALGIRRSAGSKVWPFLLVVASFAPAAVAVGVPLVIADAFGDGVVGPLDVVGYGDQLGSTAIVVLAFTATTVPSLLTRERRDRVLSLYFSTAISPGEYLVGKLLAALALVLLVTLGPLLLLLVGGTVVADAPVEYARDHAGDWPRVLAAGLLVALYHAVIGLALGSLTARRVFAVGGYVALMLVVSALGGLAYELLDSEAWLALVLLDVPVSLGRSVLDDPAGEVVAPTWALVTTYVVLVGAGLATLAARYRRSAE